MINDISVGRWEYVVYFETKKGITRLVCTFNSEAEAITCVKLIEAYGLHAFYAKNLELDFNYEED